MPKKRTENNLPIALTAVVMVCVAVICVVWMTGHGKQDKTPSGEGSATDTVTSSEQTVSETDTGTDPVSSATQNKTDTVSSVSSSTTDTAVSKPTTDTVSGTSSFSKSAWYLILANYENYLPSDWSVDLSTVQSSGTRQMDSRCAAAMKQMLADAKKDGVDLLICSAYRSVQRQTENFNAKVQEYMNQGYSKEKATELTATIIAVPGSSEHHTGLAADIVTPSYQNLNAGFAKTDAFKWLYQHCAEYGFVLRYPSDKEDITKIIYEPWHYRYVGKEAAKIIMDKGLCLEEFLDQYGT